VPKRYSPPSTAEVSFEWSRFVNSKRDFHSEKGFLFSVIYDCKYIRKLPAVNKHYSGCKKLKDRQCTYNNIETQVRSKDSQVKTQLVLWIFILFKVTR
jgi:hypothetical protein